MPTTSSRLPFLRNSLLLVALSALALSTGCSNDEASGGRGGAGSHPEGVVGEPAKERG